MKLFICEKPAQGRDIARNLQCSIKKEGYIEGQGVVVTWCIGHLLQQQPPGFYEPNNKPWRRAVLPIVPTAWKKCVVDKTGKQFRIIQALLKKTDTVVIATDADREGDVIARELLDFCNYKGNVERLWLSALDDASIQKALADIRPGNSTEALYAAGLGRQRADWLVGMNMTMATTSYFSKGQGVLSVGRVQTPTLQLVVNRDKAIEEFKSETYYVLNATFKTVDSIPFVTTWQVPALIADDNGRCVNSDAIKKVANSISQNAGFIAQFYDKPKTQAPPTCLTLSTLQKLASQYFSLGAKKTQEVAQRLYETYKATTYPRTDCGYLPLSQFNDASDIIHAMGNTLPALQALVGRADTRIQSPVWNDEKITAHHAIIPTTNCNVKVDAMSEIERKLYSLICRYYLAQFLGDYTYSQRKVVVKCANETFVASRNTPVEQGFRLAIGRVMEDKKENDTSSIIPDVTVGDATQTLDAEVLDKQTKAPPRYTEGSLIAAMKNIAKTVSDAALKKTLMESAGIGTEATRATIIELLLKRNFLTTSGKYIISTEKGRTLLTYCPELLKNPATTAQWEQMLEDVAKGVVTLDQFLQMQKTALKGMLEGIDTLYHKAIPAVKPEDNAHPCISCQKPMVKKQGKHGVFWSCSGYPNCMTTMQDDNGKPAIKKPHVTSNVDCPTCKQHKLVKRQGRRAPFWGCSGFPTCRAMFWDKDNQPDFVNIPKARGAA